MFKALPIVDRMQTSLVIVRDCRQRGCPKLSGMHRLVQSTKHAKFVLPASQKQAHMLTSCAAHVVIYLACGLQPALNCVLFVCYVHSRMYMNCNLSYMQ